MSIMEGSLFYRQSCFLLLLLVMPRRDPSGFSTQSGRSLILDPGVSASCSRPDPGLLLSLLQCHESTDALHDLSTCYMLTFCLLGIIKLFYSHITYNLFVTST